MSEVFALISLLAPGIARAFGMLIVLPLGEGAHLLSRSMLSLILGTVVSCHTHSSAELSFFVIGEGILTGALLGMPIALAVEAAAGLGELFDAGRGQLMAQTYDPLTNVTSSHMALLFRSGYWALLLSNGALGLGITLLVRAPGLSSSYECLMSHLTQNIQYLGQVMIVSACVFSGCFLVIDAGLGFTGKFVKGMSVSNASFILKFFAGMLALTLAGSWEIDSSQGLLLATCSAL